MADRVALVTGASRGVGRGVALGLGEAGATVYVTGRTVDVANAAVPLDGTVLETAEMVSGMGGKSTAIPCDHDDDQQVEAVFERIDAEQGRLDVLVSNAWRGYEGYSTGEHFPPDHPFWLKPLSYWDENLVGLRWAYVAGVLAARRMTEKRAGLIVNVSFGVPEPGNPAYNIAKSGADRLTWEMAHQLRPHGIAVISLYPGLVRTESVLLNAQYFDMTQSESPLFTGRAVAALAADPDVIRRSGQAVTVAELSRAYGFADIDNPFKSQES
ncbi:MAG: SDR family NAD(P)-dependent oxidoreductase [Chloroflexi bacterium]|nr:SDR family NAD(P)-dependent oxidoreductase [Chloroflexota bacterium]